MDRPIVKVKEPEKIYFSTKANANNLLDVIIDPCMWSAKNCEFDATITNGDTNPGTSVEVGAPYDPIDDDTADESNLGTANTVKSSA